MHATTLKRASLLIFSILLIASQQAAAQAGHLDPTFGSGGIVTTDFGDQTGSSNVASANAVTIQSNGKIVVGGGVPSHTGFPVPAVARYNTNGSLDTTFGTGGMVSTPSIEDVPFTAITLQTDGKIVAVAGGFTAYVVRYTSAGVLDSTFGTGGIVTLSFINGPSASGVLVQPDGKILVADRGLFRLLSNGQFDTSFGSGAQRGPLVIRPLGWRFFLIKRSWWLRPFREPAASSLNMTRMAVSTPPSELTANWQAPELRTVWFFWAAEIFLPAGV